jgi:hypothetical protein
MLAHAVGDLDSLYGLQPLVNSMPTTHRLHGTLSAAARSRPPQSLGRRRPRRVSQPMPVNVPIIAHCQSAKSG